MNTRLIFILASLLLLISCNKGPEKDVYVSLDHTQWFKYEEGDTLLFRNNTSAVDTYILDRVSTDYVKLGTKYIISEVFEVDYKGITECNNCPLWGFVRTPNAASFVGSFSSMAQARSGDTTTEYMLGDTTIYNVYVVEDLLIDTTHFNVKAIYYSHVYGIIRYDMYDDRVYELQLE